MSTFAAQGKSESSGLPVMARVLPTVALCAIGAALARYGDEAVAQWTASGRVAGLGAGPAAWLGAAACWAIAVTWLVVSSLPDPAPTTLATPDTSVRVAFARGGVVSGPAVRDLGFTTRLRPTEQILDALRRTSTRLQRERDEAEARARAAEEQARLLLAVVHNLQHSGTSSDDVTGPGRS